MIKGGMTSEEIKKVELPICPPREVFEREKLFWLREIAFQLARIAEGKHER
jgi:ribosomal protein L19